MRIFIADGIFSNLFKLERVDFNFVNFTNQNRFP